MASFKVNREAEFWSAVEKSEHGCWRWTLGKCKGYGYFIIVRGNKAMRTHRIAWILTRGAIPKGLCVLHRCDNPSCVRPDHLFLGTRADNARDCISKGRAIHVRGEQHPANKLTAYEVINIRKRYQKRLNGYSKLAEQFGVGTATIQQIVNRRIWKHI